MCTRTRTRAVRAARVAVVTLRAFALITRLVMLPYVWTAQAATAAADKISTWEDSQTSEMIAIAPSKIIVVGPCTCGCGDTGRFRP